MQEDKDIPQFEDLLFRQKRKHGKFRVVPAPVPCTHVADTHAHVHLLEDPVLEFAKCAAWGVSFVCDIVDIHEDDESVFDYLETARRSYSDVLLDSYHTTFDVIEEEQVVPGVELDSCLPPDFDEGALADVRLRFAVGCHPHNAKHYDDALEERLIARLADAQVCAVGEIGLDYHYDLSPRAVQQEVFRRQLRLAHKTGLPVALHLREAHDDAFRILQEEGFPEAGVLLHCCSLSPDEIKPWVEAGCYFAYGGTLTFKNGDVCRAGALTVPRDRLLTETDSPYMTPEPMRGMPCGPAHTIFAADKLCEVFGCTSFDERLELLDQIRNNALALLDRQPTPWQLEQYAQAMSPEEGLS